MPPGIGLAVRFARAPFLSWPGDDESWARVASAGVQHLALYERLSFPYPPAFGHLMQSLGMILQHLGLSSSSFASFPSGMNSEYSLYITSPALNVAFKALTFAFDIATPRGPPPAASGIRFEGELGDASAPESTLVLDPDP